MLRFSGDFTIASFLPASACLCYSHDLVHVIVQTEERATLFEVTWFTYGLSFPVYQDETSVFSRILFGTQVVLGML
jgi:hypothetical protein